MEQQTLHPKVLKFLAAGGATSRSTDPLTPEKIREYEQIKADRLNKMAGNLTGIDCPLCKNRGYFRYVDAEGYPRNAECECMVTRRNLDRIERSGLKDMLSRYTFETWQIQEEWQNRAVEKARSYASHPDGWFLACGSVGTGKTHLCTAICDELMRKGVDTRYMLWRDVSTQAKAVVNDQAEYAAIVEPLKSVQCLYIDDMYKTGKGQQPTVGDVNLAFEILNARYNDSGKLTIISTERSMKELVSIDEAVGSRIYERCRKSSFSFDGRQNWRLR